MKKKHSDFTFVMRLTLCRYQKEEEKSNSDMASLLGISLQQIKRLRTGQRTIRTAALQKFEILLQEAGW